MTISKRRVRAIVVKELHEYRHTGSIIYGMAALPVLLCIQPLIVTFAVGSAGAPAVHREHVLLYLLLIPSIVPGFVASYSVVGERQQGALEPMLATPIRREELLLGKALAALLPSLAVAYTVFGLFVAAIEAFAQPGIAPALITGPDLLAQLGFTPLLAGLSIWIAIAVSTRSTDPRTAQQLSVLASLPTVVVTSLISFGVIPRTLQVAIIGSAALLVLNRQGWRMTSALFHTERLIAPAR